jgi:DNA polymerase I-like protein with 3'-5' exonuclease and polymerase domains
VDASGNVPALGAFERAAINMPLQSLAADIVKLAMVRVEACAAEFPGALLTLSIHDELLLEVPDGTMERIAPRIVEIMEHVVALSVPLAVQVKRGKSWGAMETFRG